MAKEEEEEDRGAPAVKAAAAGVATPCPPKIAINK
jgi:hypothetical protein